MSKGRFITLEGGEGAGKSTLMAFLKEKLFERGHDVVVTREPGGCDLGEDLRTILLHQSKPISAKAELFLFLAARVEHIDKVIIPALESGKIVLCDRFSDSSIAYQGCGKNLGFEYVQTLCSLAQGSCVPDVSLFINVDPKLGIERIDHRRRENNDDSGRDRIEKEELSFHTRVRDGYVRLANLYPERIYTIDGAKKIEQVAEIALDTLIKRLVL